MPVEALQCKECGTTYPLEARYVCDELLRAARGRATTSTASTPDQPKRRIQAGPPDIWRYADFLPFEQPPQTALAPA